MGAGTPSDTGATNSIGLKFQTANQLYFQLGTVTASAAFFTLPICQPMPGCFVAAVYDGQNLAIYQGTDTNSVSLISHLRPLTLISAPAVLYTLAIARIANVRLTAGWMISVFIPVLATQILWKVSASLPCHFSASVLVRPNGNGIQLIWPAGTLQSATNIYGPWNDLGGATSPYDVSPAGPQQFYRIRF